MIEVLLGVFLTVITFAIAILYLRIRKLSQAVSHHLKATYNLLETVQMQSDINISQQKMNEIINTNLEILGVHTNLIKPSIGYEASQFLAWYNKRKKEGENG
jgi:predicted Holliday junction resolvase-like endonuclease